MSRYAELRARLQAELDEPGHVTRSELEQVLIDFPAEDEPAPLELTVPGEHLSPPEYPTAGLGGT